MGIKTTESSSLIKLSRFPAFWLMRTMIFFSGKGDGKIYRNATGFSKLISFARVPKNPKKPVGERGQDRQTAFKPRATPIHWMR